MRVPTMQTHLDAFRGIQLRQTEQARLQEQLSTGLRVNSPGDDPVAAAQGELARSRLARLDQEKRVGELAAGILATAEGALGQGVDLLQSVRETLVAAGNGIYTDSERRALAQHVRASRERLVALANTTDGAGGHVFAGQGALSQPLSGNSAPAYAPAAGVQRVGEGGRFAATVDGRATFMSLPQGNGVFVTASDDANAGTAWIDPGAVSAPLELTGHALEITVSGPPGSQTYSVQDLTTGTLLSSGVPFTPGAAIDVQGQRVRIMGTPAAGDRFDLAPAGRRSVFETLDAAADALEASLTAPRYNERLEQAQASLDRALDAMILMRSQVGEEMRSVEDMQQADRLQHLTTSARRSGLRDLDFASAISGLQANQTALEAALRSYAGIAKTSLFDLLR